MCKKINFYKDMKMCQKNLDEIKIRKMLTFLDIRNF